ncbi:MAG: 2-phospho-L-lactate transferase [Anaerolineales bacterium]|nr:2-phospho-L-lactate transferase [Anaerolineales bacterium]
MRITALAGGVGGAKLAHGLAQILPPEDLTIIVNTGDDFEHFGLYISPDLDTVCYTLAGLANPVTGWGRADESWNAMENLKRLGAPDWFNLGDRDLATHLERTRRLKEGQTLSQITRDFCAAWGVKHTVLPMSDDPVRTIVETVEYGELPFQEYFVKHRCEPRVKGFRFAGVESARPAPGVLEAIQQADAIVICPSNPWVSIDPILATITSTPHPPFPPVFRKGKGVSIAISPIIGGKTVKGPAAKMFAELGTVPSALAVAGHYAPLLTGFVIDVLDADYAKNLERLGMYVLVAQTLMNSPQDRRRLAEEVVEFCHQLLTHSRRQ